MLDVEVISDIDRFASVKAEWESQLSQLGYYPLHMSHDWIYDWWSILGVNKDVRITLCRDSLGLTGVAAWTISRFRLGPLYVPLLESFGDIFSSRSDVLLIRHPKETLKRLETVRDEFPWVIANIGRYPTFSPAASALDNIIAQSSARGVTRQTLQCPMVSTECDWESFLKTKSSKFRRNIGRAHSTLTNHFRHYRFSSGCIENQLKDIETISQNTWKQSQGTSLVASSLAWDFFKKLMRRAAKTGNLSLELIYDTDKPVSFAFGLRHRDRLYALKTGYDMNYSKFGLGKISIRNLIESAFGNRNVKLVDLDCVPSGDSYKHRWATHFETYRTWRIFRNSLAGQFIATGYKLGRNLRKLWGH